MDYGIDKPTPATNRTAPVTRCATCGGDRFVLIDDTDGFETYARCGQCNVAPVKEREPVAEGGWWKE